VVPGHAYSALGKKTLARTVLAGYGLAAFIFMAALGTMVGNMMFGLMISFHVTSAAYSLGRYTPTTNIWQRLGTVLSVLLVLGLGVYSPLRSLLTRYVVMPMEVDKKRIVVNRMLSAQSVRPGSMVAYEIAGMRDPQMSIASGYEMNPVLAMPGARVRFRAESVEVNGLALPRQDYMPAKGEVIVPAKHWFIWPKFAINRNATVTEANISAAMLQSAMVSETQYVGRPFQLWFGRRQSFL